MAVALPFPRPGPREPAPVTIAILPASRPLMSRRLLPLRGCAATACHTIEPDEGLPHEVTHVRSLRAQVRGAGYDGLPVLLPRGVARVDHAPLLRLADPRRPAPDPRGHRVPRRRRAGARDPRLREPGGDGRARGREAGGRARGAHHAPSVLRAGEQTVPGAEYWIQQDEVAFWTGPYGHAPAFRQSANVGALARLVTLTYANRVRIIDGDRQVLPGIG